MGQAKLVTSILFITIFVIAITSYAIIWASDNNAAVSLGDSNSFTTINSSLQSDMNIFTRDVNSSSEGLTQSTVEPGSDILKSSAVFQNLGMTVRTVGNLLRLMKTEIFGNNPAFFVVLSAISSFMIFLFVMYIWKTFKGGDPD